MMHNRSYCFRLAHASLAEAACNGLVRERQDDKVHLEPERVQSGGATFPPHPGTLRHLSIVGFLT